MLWHTGGATTEYQGVGKSGDRAEATADALNAYLAAGDAKQTFALREGSLPVAAGLALVALLGLVCISYFFSKLRVARSPAALEITIERWPAPPQRHTLRHDAAPRVTVRERTVNDQQFFSLWLEPASGPGVDLGLSFRTAARAAAEQETISQLLRG